MAEARYLVEVLTRAHDRVDFSCGIETLDRYFRQQAGQDQRRALAVPYVLVEAAGDRVVGYYTLSAQSIVPTSLPESMTRKLARYGALPSILIGRLAVDRRYRGRGLGGLLLVDALRRCLEISHEIGAVAVVVDAKDDAAHAFYEHYGFVRLLDHDQRLFLPIAAIERLDLPRR